MAWTVTPRNTTSGSGHQASGTSLTVTISPTATVAGDLCVVAVCSRGSGTPTVTPPTGLGFVALEAPASAGPGIGLYASNTVTAGTTSMAWKLTAATSVLDLIVLYSCWPGGSAQQLFSEGANHENGTLTTSGSNGIVPSLSTLAATIGQELGVWAAVAEVSATAQPANPTGSGTWTSAVSANGATSSFIAARMSAQVGPVAPADFTASGSVVTLGSGSTYAAAMAAFPPALDQFFAFFGD